MGRRRSLFPRSGRSSSGDAALGVIVIAAIAVAALGVYLIVIGAIALIGWLVAVAAKRSPKASTTHIVPATTPTHAPPPSQQFYVVIPIEPRVFFDPAQLEATTKNVFSVWARQLPKAPRHPEAAIRKLELRTRLIGRLTTKLDGRRFVWKQAPYRGRDRLVGARAIDPATLDPYSPPVDLRSRSSCLSLCNACGGDGRCECTSCGGAGRVTCRECNGDGKVYGFAKNGSRRLLNCKTCKGKSTLLCNACTKGQVACGACDQSGRVEHWLEIDGGPRDADIQIEPDGEQTRAFAWGVDGTPATADEIAKDARVVCSVSLDRQLFAGDLPTQVPKEWIDANWTNIQARLQPGERIVSQTFTLLEVPSVEVTYGLGAGQQAIEFEGLRLLAPPISFDQIFAARARSLTRLAYGLFTLPVLILIVYLTRGDYFAQATTAGIVGLAALAGLFVYFFFARASLGRPAWIWLAALVAPIGVATALALFNEPSVARARGLIDSGQLDLAKAELEALGTTPDDPLWSDFHLKQARAATSCETATSFASKIASTAPQHAKAQAHADQLAVAAAEQALSTGDTDRATILLSCASETVRSAKTGQAIQARIKLTAGNACVTSANWSCALAAASDAHALGAGPQAEELQTSSRKAIQAAVDDAVASSRTEKDLARRVGHQQRAIDLWTKYLLPEKSSEPSELVALRGVAKRDQEALVKQEAIAQRKREAEEKKRLAEEARQRAAAERAEKRRLAEEERRERASYPRSLRCCDGTLSPSCMCGGSRRGCCSHHGGVCGCE